ncbi:MAG: hypothetical protein KF819_31230, partial [Labilithrix sp.]|nr:hypothetical protein [Labilithrix sp.]
REDNDYRRDEDLCSAAETKISSAYEAVRGTIAVWEQAITNERVRLTDVVRAAIPNAKTRPSTEAQAKKGA